jgi:hypothetical protein
MFINGKNDIQTGMEITEQKNFILQIKKWIHEMKQRKTTLTVKRSLQAND